MYRTGIPRTASKSFVLQLSSSSGSQTSQMTYGRDIAQRFVEVAVVGIERTMSGTRFHGKSSKHEAEWPSVNAVKTVSNGPGIESVPGKALQNRNSRAVSHSRTTPRTRSRGSLGTPSDTSGGNWIPLSAVRTPYFSSCDVKTAQLVPPRWARIYDRNKLADLGQWSHGSLTIQLPPLCSPDYHSCII